MNSSSPDHEVFSGRWSPSLFLNTLPPRPPTPLSFKTPSLRSPPTSFLNPWSFCEPAEFESVSPSPTPDTNVSLYKDSLTLDSLIHSEYLPRSTLLAIDNKDLSTGLPFQSQPIPNHCQEPKKLPTRGREWVDMFKERQRRKHQSPPRRTAERCAPQGSRVKKPKAKKPLAYPKTSNKPKQERKNIYDDFSSPSSQGSWKEKEEDADTKMDNDLKQEEPGRIFKTALATQNATIPEMTASVALQMVPYPKETGKKSSSRKDRPTFLNPHSDTVQIALGKQVFAIYRDYLDWHCPILAEACSSTGRPDTLEMLADVDVDVFCLFVQWMYKDSLNNKYGQPAYQHRLMALWVLGKRLRISSLQNDAIDMLEERRKLDESIQKKTFRYVYANTTAGDTIRRYLVYVCYPIIDDFDQEEIKEFFPIEMLEDICEMDKIKTKKCKVGVDMDVVTALSMEKYHVGEDG